MKNIYIAFIIATTMLAVGCATPASSYNDQKHGIVVGSIETGVPEPLNHYQIQLIARKKNSWLGDAITLDLTNNSTEIYHAILSEGEYAFSIIRVTTGQLTMVPKDPPDLAFTVKKGELTQLGNLRLQFEYRKGSFALPLPLGELSATAGDSAARRTVVESAYPDIAIDAMPVSTQVLLKTAYPLPFEPEQDNEFTGARVRYSF